MSVRIINADVMEGLAQLADESVHCVVTSPPYFGLRAYLPEDHPSKVHEIGSESTLDAHIKKLVEVFREVRRVLRSDGVCWLNYGDAYCNTDKWGGGGDNIGKQTKDADGEVPSWAVRRRKQPEPGLKPKDLMLIPFRLALALQADGWWVRSRLPWLKPNGMPSSVEDRPGTSIEEIFMLTKSPRYFYDGEAIKQVAKYPAGPNAPDKVKLPQGQGFSRKNRAAETDQRARPPGSRAHKGLSLARGAKNEASFGKIADASARQRAGFNDRWEAGSSDGQRAFRQSDVFFSALGDVRGTVANAKGEIAALHVATQPYAEAHFATFPPRLIEPLILAGTSAKGCCSKCGAPHERILEKTFVPQPDVSAEKGVRGAAGQKPMDASDSREGFPRGTTATTTIGWKATCDCEASVVPCIVLDPFMGAGTTGMVADRLGRNAIGFELSDEHAERAQRRVAADRGSESAGWLFDEVT